MFLNMVINGILICVWDSFILEVATVIQLGGRVTIIESRDYISDRDLY